MQDFTAAFFRNSRKLTEQLNEEVRENIMACDIVKAQEEKNIDEFEDMLYVFDKKYLFGLCENNSPKIFIVEIEKSPDTIFLTDGNKAFKYLKENSLNNCFVKCTDIEVLMKEASEEEEQKTMYIAFSYTSDYYSCLSQVENNDCVGYQFVNIEMIDKQSVRTLNEAKIAEICREIGVNRKLISYYNCCGNKVVPEGCKEFKDIKLFVSKNKKIKDFVKSKENSFEKVF